MWSKNGETSDKKAWKKKKKQRWLEHEWARNDSGSAPTTKVNVPNLASTTRKDLSLITCFIRVVMPPCVPSLRGTSQKTSDSLDDLHLGD